MVRAVGRKMLWVYALLMLLAAYGYARYDVYMMDGDGTAFLDIAQYLNTHHAALAVNGYWNPGYAAVLAVAERVAHPSVWRELAVARYTNIVVFAFAVAGGLAFTTALARARRVFIGEGGSAVPDGALHLLGLALLVLSMERELPIAAPRADTLLLAFLLLAGALLVRLLLCGDWLKFAAIGLTLGCAYLTKSFGFVPSVLLLTGLLLFGMLRGGESRARWLGGVVLAGVLFGLVAGPYIAAISRRLGHLSTGDSARLNYAFFVDLTPRWHEWFHHDLGHAGGVFVHPEAVLAAQPPVFSYAAHPYGTFPLWFDPAWWTMGLKPHVWLAGQILRLIRNVELLSRYVLGRPEPFVLLALLVAFGATVRRGWNADGWRIRAWAVAPLAWGLLMFGIYLPVDFQDRYLTGPLLLLLLPLFALLEARASGREELEAGRGEGVTRTVATALILLFAWINLAEAATFLADRRRHIPRAEQRHPGFDPQVFTAAAALDKLGLRPGDKVACMGDLACYTDFYWARLAGTQILAEVETPNEANPLQEWNELPDKQTVTQPLARMGVRYIISLFPNSTAKPQGWVQLGNTNFFAYPLQGAVDPGAAQAVAAYTPAP